jgi:phospholipase/lecithinase/hemolysin
MVMKSIMKRSPASLVSVLAILLTAANVAAAPFSGLYAFGDSLVDIGSSPSATTSIYRLLDGNCDPLHPCPPYFEGRYSNGPVAVERLADSVLPGGGNPTDFRGFALAGATTGVGNFGDRGTATESGLLDLPGMQQEIELYLTLSGGAADPNALYFLWGGAVDYLTGDSPLLAAQNIASYVGALAGAGAQHFLVPNLGDLALTPSVRSEGQEAEGQAFTLAFNAALATQLGTVASAFPAAEIVSFDTYAFFNAVVANPADFGFTNTRDACLPSILEAPCADPDEHVFWDSFHPTARAAGVIASAFAAAVSEPQTNVPEPATAVLLVAGITAACCAGRRKRFQIRGVLLSRVRGQGNGVACGESSRHGS